MVYLQARCETIVKRGARAVEGRLANGVVLGEEREPDDFARLGVLIERKV